MEDDKYSEYVEHPRFGKGPIYTGFDPDPNNAEIHLRCIPSDLLRSRIKRIFGQAPPLRKSDFGAIAGTAVEADLSKQTPAVIPLTHYYDEDRTCQKCGRHFIFFALEQKYWYEELHFPLVADCVCCSTCRKADQKIARQRKRYEELRRIENQTADEMLEMASCCLTMIEYGFFGERQTEHVRAIINQLPTDHQVGKNYEELISRLHNLEKQMTNSHEKYTIH
jgi:hypothetical protein